MNAQTPAADDPSSHSADTPGVLRQFRSVVDVPIDRHSASSIALLKEDLASWQASLRTQPQGRENSVVAQDADFAVIEVSLASPPGAMNTTGLVNIPTSLTISGEQSRALQAFGREALYRNADWQRLLEKLRSSQKPAP